MRHLSLALLIGLVSASILSQQGLRAQHSEIAGDGAAAEVSEIRQDSPGYQLAAEIQGQQVVNAIGEEIGEISNIIIQGDRVTHATISIGGFVGLGGSDVVVPFSILSFEG